MKLRILTPFDSLRSRHWLGTIILALLVLSSILVAHYYVEQSKNTVSHNLEIRSEVLQLSRHVRQNLLNAFAAMDSFLLDPNQPNKVDDINFYMNSAIQFAKAIANHEWAIKHVPGKKLIQLPNNLTKIADSIDYLVKTRKDPFKQFPSLGLSNQEMRPYRNNFNNAISLAIFETTASFNQANQEVLLLLMDVRHFWTQMVSNFRLYVANRLGSFNEDSLPIQEKSIETLFGTLTQRLEQLERLDRDDSLGFETSNALEQLLDSSKAWFFGFEKVKAIHSTNNWRTDKDIISSLIEPQSSVIWDFLLDFDEQIEAAVEQDIKALSDTAYDQEKFLWGATLILFLLIGASFVYSEKVIYGPIAKIAAALRDEAAGRFGVVLPNVSSKETRNLVEAFADMRSQVRSRQLALEHKSLHDELTGLPNRSLLFDRIQQAIINTESAQNIFSVLIIDISNLKEINDTIGHHGGDKLLAETSVRLRKIISESDTVSRIGGNEFAVLLSETSKDSAINFTNKLVTNLSRQIQFDEISVHPSLSVGLVYYPEHGLDPNILVQRADIAMSVAKRNQREVMIYSEADDQFSIDRLTLISDLKKAIRFESLELHFQPKLDILNQQVTGVEALLRWKHHDFGWVNSSDIISMAEQSGLIVPITHWTLRHAVEQCAKWQSVGMDLNVAINVSVYALQDENISVLLKKVLHTYAVPAGNITLEITESAMMTNPVKVSDILRGLHDIGVNISADDFGTGFSSLSYLKQLPVNELKIDKSFVMDMVKDSTDQVIVKSAIALAHNLGLKVVAEGIEDLVTLRALREMGCDTGQGFYFCKPLSATSLLKWIKSYSHDRQSA